MWKKLLLTLALTIPLAEMGIRDLQIIEGDDVRGYGYGAVTYRIWTYNCAWQYKLYEETQ